MAISSSKPRALTRAYDEIWLGGVQSITHRVEDLAAGGDFTARAIFRAPYPAEILSVTLLPEVVSAGIDGGNTFVANLTNVTATETIATLTRTSDFVANTPISFTLTAANVDVAGDAVIALDVTQGATANAGVFSIQVVYRVLPL